MKKVGLMVSEIPFSNMPVLLKASGLDFFILDYEHGSFDYSAMFQMITNAKLSGIECIVRLPNNERKDIIKLLDMGASGLLLPMTSTKEDVEKVVMYAKYPPLGKRGVSTMRAHTLYNPPKVLDYMEDANKKVKVFAQIETVDGVNNLESILSVEGVSGALIGPNDLSADYGCLGDDNAKEVLNAIEKLALYNNKSIGIITGNKNYLKKAHELGYEYYSIGSELNAISNYSKIIIEENK